jgi:hypothetical protein
MIESLCPKGSGDKIQAPGTTERQGASMTLFIHPLPLYNWGATVPRDSGQPTTCLPGALRSPPPGLVHRFRSSRAAIGAAGAGLSARNDQAPCRASAASALAPSGGRNQGGLALCRAASAAAARQGVHRGMAASSKVALTFIRAKIRRTCLARDVPPRHSQRCPTTARPRAIDGKNGRPHS